MEREANVEVLDFDKSQNIEVLVQEEVQLDINVPLFYIKSGEEDVKAYVTNHAKPEITAFTQEAAQKGVNTVNAATANGVTTVENKAQEEAANIAGDAIEQVEQYKDSTVIPALQEFVGEAQTQATSAATSMEQAALSATAASNYASNASANADNSAIWAEGTDSEVTALGGVHSSKVWSDRAEQAAAKAEASTQGGFYNRVHDCILENPRYIIWEQDGNTLTLKAGTKLWYPDGRSVVLENDISGTMTSSSDLVWVDLENNSLLFKDSVAHGPQSWNTVSDFPDYLNDGDMGYIVSETKFVMSQNGLPVGDYLVPLPVETIIDWTTYTKYLIIDESTFNKGMIVFYSNIANTEYIFIPQGIKTLACSGLKTDGSYNNIEYITPSVMALDDSASSGLMPKYFAIKTDGTVQVSDIGFRVTSDNYLQNLSTNEVFSGVRLGNYYNGNKFTNIYDTLDLQNSTRVFYWDD